MKTRIWLATLTALTMTVTAEESPTAESRAKDAAYQRTLSERATKIVSNLGLPDTARSNRVHGIIVQQYRDLNVIHTERDAQVKSAKEKAGTDKTAANSVIETAHAETKPKLDKLHGELLAKLSAELSAEQVDNVKDGLTYGVAPLTYGVFLKMYPELTTGQKAQIKSWLNEARELAMDGSTAEEKHAVFGKYKGKINNYLSKAGYDAKKAEQNLKKPTPPSSESKPK